MLGCPWREEIVKCLRLLCFFFFNINLFILIGGQLLYNIVLVLPYTDMNQPWVYVRKLRILPFENLDCIEKARPSDNEGVFTQYIYLLS